MPASKMNSFGKVPYFKKTKVLIEHLADAAQCVFAFVYAVHLQLYLSLLYPVKIEIEIEKSESNLPRNSENTFHCRWIRTWKLISPLKNT